MILNILELKLKTNYSLVDDREDAVAQLHAVRDADGVRPGHLSSEYIVSDQF